MAPPEFIDQVQPTADGPGQQKNCAIDIFNPSKAGTGKGVIGGLFVCVERYLVLELARYSPAVCRDVRDLALCEP